MTPVEGIKTRSIRGGILSAGSQGLSLLVQTASTVALARLLSPEDYGLQGMVLPLIGAIGMFRDVGLGAVTIQRESITQAELSLLFWISAGVGCALSAISSALAPAVAAFYGDSRLVLMTIVMSTSFVLGGVGAQHTAMLYREMRFREIASINVVSLLVSAASAIVMAALGCRYWSLVAMTVTGSAASSLGAWLVVRWLPGRPRWVGSVSPMLRFGGTMTVNGLVVYIGYNLEKVLLGRFWGADALGLYGRAYSLLNIPVQQLHSAMHTVGFSALSRLQAEPERLKRSFLKAYLIVLSLSVPITVGCVFFAGDLIPLILGRRWIETVPLLRLLCPVATALGLINPFGWFLSSTGRAARSMWISFLIAPTVVLGVAMGLPYGPEGVAAGYSGAMALLTAPVIAWSIRGTGVSGWDVVEASKAPIVAGVAATIAGLVIDAVIPISFGSVGRPLVVGGGVLGVYTWTLMMPMGKRDVFVDLFKEAIGVARS